MSDVFWLSEEQFARLAPTILVISLLSRSVVARMVRARLLELREREFVVAICGMGNNT
jgi:peptide/nickel transport system permease protein